MDILITGLKHDFPQFISALEKESSKNIKNLRVKCSKLVSSMNGWMQSMILVQKFPLTSLRFESGLKGLKGYTAENIHSK